MLDPNSIRMPKGKTYESDLEFFSQTWKSDDDIKINNNRKES